MQLRPLVAPTCMELCRLEWRHRFQFIDNMEEAQGSSVQWAIIYYFILIPTQINNIIRAFVPSSVRLTFDHKCCRLLIISLLPALGGRGEGESNFGEKQVQDLRGSCRTPILTQSHESCRRCLLVLLFPCRSDLGVLCHHSHLKKPLSFGLICYTVCL